LHPQGSCGVGRAGQSGNGVDLRADRARAAERREKAFDMYCMGMRYSAIGRALEISHTRASELVREAFDQIDAKWTTEECFQEKKAILERQQLMLPVYMARALSGDEKAAVVVLRIDKDRRSMLGLDAPKEIHVEHDYSPAQIDALHMELSELIGMMVEEERKRKALEPVTVEAKVKTTGNGNGNGKKGT
jgi:hypothetical protein